METQGGKEIYVSLVHFPVRALGPGPGPRAGIWFQGCSMRCPGCISRHAWERDEEGRTTVPEVLKIVEGCLGRGGGGTGGGRGGCGDAGAGCEPACGVTISGGEPFEQPEALLELVQGLSCLGFDDILVYSGIEAGRLQAEYPEILRLIAALIDGRFERGVLTRSAWKGSENQKLIVLSENPRIVARYRAFESERADAGKRRLQIVEKSGKIFIIGIPDQKDTEEILNVAL